VTTFIALYYKMKKLYWNCMLTSWIHTYIWLLIWLLHFLK